MADTLNLSFPDQSYSSSNKPSVVTLKDDLTAIEDTLNDDASEINDHETRLDAAEASIIDGRGIHGGLINGKIVRTVTSSNLTVAIKTLAGADPSAADPVYVVIDGSIRSITAALSITLNAGTHYFAAGTDVTSTTGGLSGHEVDYFVFAIWNTNTSAVMLGFSRAVFSDFYSEFNATNTHQGYLAVSSGTAPAASDTVQPIGRFNATLSSSFNWSIPTVSVIIQRPVVHTRMLTFTPGFANGSNAPGNATRTGLYQFIGNHLHMEGYFTWGSTTVFNTTFRIYGHWTYDRTNTPGEAYLVDTGTNTYAGYGCIVSSGARFFEMRSGSTAVTNSAPFTWAATDVLSFVLDLLIDAA